MLSESRVISEGHRWRAADDFLCGGAAINLRWRLPLHFFIRGLTLKEDVSFICFICLSFFLLLRRDAPPTPPSPSGHSQLSPAAMNTLMKGTFNVTLRRPPAGDPPRRHAHKLQRRWEVRGQRWAPLKGSSHFTSRGLRWNVFPWMFIVRSVSFERVIDNTRARFRPLKGPVWKI